MSPTDSKARINAQTIKETAEQHGFYDCGVATAEKLHHHEQPLSQYLENQWQGPMKFMTNHLRKRLDPRLLVPGTQTIISLLYPYYPKNFFPEKASYKISRYALGEDYHMVVKEKAEQLAIDLTEKLGHFKYRVFTDTPPMLEKAWAQKAGLGRTGKNTLLIHPEGGSFFFLAEILTDLIALPSQPVEKDLCHNCTLCIEACPTNALKPYKLNASQCISCLTVESKKEPIPDMFKGKYRQWIFGCDICQEVCPHNSNPVPHNEPRFTPKKGLLTLSEAQWENMSRETFDQIFEKSVVKRIGLKGLQKNIRFLAQRDRPPQSITHN